MPSKTLTAKSKFRPDESLELFCLFIQIQSRTVKPSEFYLTNNAIRIKFSTLKVPLMIRNSGIENIELYSEGSKSFFFLHTTSKTWANVQDYLSIFPKQAFNSKFASASSNTIVLTFNKIDNTDIKYLKEIYLEKIEELDQLPEVDHNIVKEYLSENSSISKKNVSKAEPLRQQVIFFSNL